MDWTNFFIATAGASATLLGLLFVAIQLNMEALAADPQSRWRALARSTFNHFVSIFILSLLMLFLSANDQVSSLMLMVVAGLGLIRLLLNWLPIWKRAFQTRSERIIELAWWLASPAAAYLAMGFFAAEIVKGGPAPVHQQNIGYCIVGLFAITLRNSWKLLIEVSLGPTHKSNRIER